MQPPTQTQIDHLVSAILNSPKYRSISEDVIRNLCRRELLNGRQGKDVIKAVKNTLHQVAGAYLAHKTRYDEWLDDLAAAHTHDAGHCQAACLRTLRHHASTRERIGILHEFYTQTLATARPIRSVLDIACGLNPLTIPWMPLDRDITYYAYDIDTDLITFLNRFFRMVGLHGEAQLCDVSATPPTQRADVAFVLKAIPTLEHLHKAASLDLLRTLNVEYLLVSFPVHSLGGRDKHMRSHYETRFLTNIQTEPWSITRFEFATELVFLVKKHR